MKKILFLSLLALLSSEVFSQGSPDYGSGMKINFNEDGSKYIRFIAWGQMYAQYNDDVPDEQKSLEFSTRRARILTYAQITPKFGSLKKQTFLFYLTKKNLFSQTVPVSSKGNRNQDIMGNTFQLFVLFLCTL